LSLADTLELTILDHRPMEISSAWADEIVFPYYQGLSISNLAHTVIRLLEGKPPRDRWGSAPLDPRLWEPYWGDAKRIVLFISDGLGWRLLQQIMAEDPITAQVVADLTGHGTLTPITSIVPSTTAAALPTIWTGATPTATGMIGTTLFLRELNSLIDMLHYKPVNGGRFRSEVVEEWGLDLQSFVPVSTLGEELSTRRIPCYVLLEQHLFGSGLSRIMHRGVQHVVRHFSYSDLWIDLRDLLRATRRERCFINIYWGAVDGISHLYGTVTEQSITEIRRQLTDLRDTLAAEGVGDGRTLFMFAADHGHIPVADYINLADHAPLMDAMRCGMGGEGRLAYAYLRCDYRQAVLDYLGQHFADRIIGLLPGDAIQAGLFGPVSAGLHPETAARLGDIVFVARQSVHVGDRAQRPNPVMSRHGGLSEREMLVPLMMRMM